MPSSTAVHTFRDSTPAGKTRKTDTNGKQVARLSQRYRAAGCVSYGQKWKTETGRRTI